MNTTKPSLLEKQQTEPNHPSQNPLLLDNLPSQEDIAIEFLQNHPSYLQEHPDLLMSLEIPHASGPAISLIERQVKQLRQKNKGLESKLEHLLQVAHKNDELFAYLHKVTLTLLEASHLHELLVGLYQELREGMQADFTKLRLIAPMDQVPADFRHLSVDQDHPDLQHFADFFKSGDAICGRLRKEQLHFLFGDYVEQVQSTAMISLQGKGFQGLLAIGSCDTGRFYPGMGTLFLTYLGAVTGRILQKFWQSSQVVGKKQ